MLGGSSDQEIEMSTQKFEFVCPRCKQPRHYTPKTLEESPADIIASACVRQMSTWYFEHYRGLDYEAHYYFDQNEPFEEIIKAKWNRARLDQNPKYQWGHIAHIGSAVTRKTPGLQIADMIAWATNRHEVKIPQRYDTFVIGLRHLLPSFWTVIDEQQLRKHYRPLIHHPYENRQFS